MSQPADPKLNTGTIVYRGSVKDIIRPEDSACDLIFEYSDRYSVFDWGPMPDEIPGKGRALAVIADQIFQSLEVPHHSKGLSEVNPRHLIVQAVSVLRPEKSDSGWDYAIYQERPVNTLVPMEVIFRFGVPIGSSLPGRLRKQPEYMKALGLQTVPETGAKFSEPLIELSTKLEDTDRYLGREEARQLSGMSKKEMARLMTVAEDLAKDLEKLFATSGFELWDGKFEFAFLPADKSGERQFMLVDSIGPDELRLTYDGIQISKEILRQFYAGSEWLQAVATAKEFASSNTQIDWRRYCATELGQSPERLSDPVRQIAENIYPVVANAIARSRGDYLPFPDAWSVERLVSRLREVGLA